MISCFAARGVAKTKVIWRCDGSVQHHHLQPELWDTKAFFATQNIAAVLVGRYSVVFIHRGRKESKQTSPDGPA
jgi:hypothetical protein